VVPLWLQVTAVHPGAVWLLIAQPVWSRVAPLGILNETLGFDSDDDPVFL
jgi:hypothetical protein